MALPDKLSERLWAYRYIADLLENPYISTENRFYLAQLKEAYVREIANLEKLQNQPKAA